MSGTRAACLFVFAPCVLLADLLLFIGREVVHDVEFLPDLLGSLAFDHISDSLASGIQKSLQWTEIKRVRERERERQTETDRDRERERQRERDRER